MRTTRRRRSRKDTDDKIPPEPDYVADPKPNHGMRNVVVVIGVLVLAAIIMSAIAKHGGSNSASPAQTRRYEACNIAEQFVRESLKSPGSAKFQPCSDRTVSDGPVLWNVSGYVDSQNGFGALLRSNYRVTVSYQGGTQWHLESIDVNPQ